MTALLLNFPLKHKLADDSFLGQTEIPRTDANACRFFQSRPVPLSYFCRALLRSKNGLRFWTLISGRQISYGTRAASIARKPGWYYNKVSRLQLRRAWSFTISMLMLGCCRLLLQFNTQIKNSFGVKFGAGSCH